MKRITPLKLTCVGAFVAALGVGCASTGYARYDADSDRDVGVAASADVGTDRDVRISSSTDTDIAASADLDRHESRGASAQLDTGTDRATIVVDDDVTEVEGEERVTVSALSFNPETRANWVNKFPFYDQNWNLRVIEVYTFAPDEDVEMPEFRTSLRPGETYAEAAGGTAVVSSGRARVIQHSPNPR
jgi:hypothetical protein